MPPPSKSLFGPTRQRGVVTILTASILMLLLLVMVLALDTGRLYLEKRKLQSIADMAVLSTVARMPQGICNDASVFPDALSAAQENGFPGIGNGWNLETECYNQRVKVIATHDVPTSLVLGGMFPGNTQLTATASAQLNEPIAAFIVDSQLLELNENSLLDRVLGGVGLGIENLVVLSSEGLVNSKLTPANLLRGLTGLEDLNLLTQEALIDAGANLSIDKLLEEIGKATNSDITQELSDLAVALRSQSTKPLANINLFGNGGLIRFPDNGNDVNNTLGTEINVPDILSLALFSSANKAAANLKLNAGLVVVDVGIIQPPTLAIGPVNTSASTTQISAKLSVVLLLVKIPIDLNIGGGTVTLTDIDCLASGSNADKTKFQTSPRLVSGLGGLLNAVVQLVNPIITSLLAILGLDLNTVEYEVLSVSCGVPTLVE